MRSFYILGSSNGHVILTFRKSNLFLDKASAFSKDKQFTRSDFVCAPDGSVFINVRYSKTIQFKERSYVVKLVKSNHVLCPVTAVYAMLFIYVL